MSPALRPTGILGTLSRFLPSPRARSAGPSEPKPEAATPTEGELLQDSEKDEMVSRRANGTAEASKEADKDTEVAGVDGEEVEEVNEAKKGEVEGEEGEEGEEEEEEEEGEYEVEKIIDHRMQSVSVSKGLWVVADSAQGKYLCTLCGSAS